MSQVCYCFIEGTCLIPVLSSDPNYKRIIPNDTSVDFGTDVTIECRYGTGFRNLSLYCGESGVATYELLGDNLTCPGLETNFLFICNEPSCIWLSKMSVHLSHFTFKIK